MKKQQRNRKKLQLSRATVRYLDNPELQQIAAGAPTRGNCDPGSNTKCCNSLCEC